MFPAGSPATYAFEEWGPGSDPQACLQAFQGVKPGWYFSTGQYGVGYYADLSGHQHSAAQPPAQHPTDSQQLAGAADLAAAAPAKQAAQADILHSAAQGRQPASDSASAAAQPAVPGACAEGAEQRSPVEQPATPTGVGAVHECPSQEGGSACGSESSQPGEQAKEAGQRSTANDTAGAASEPIQGGEQSKAGGEPAQHYWGQALQYLERSAHIEAGRRLLLLVKRDGNQVGPLRLLWFGAPGPGSNSCLPSAWQVGLGWLAAGRC